MAKKIIPADLSANPQLQLVWDAPAQDTQPTSVAAATPANDAPPPPTAPEPNEAGGRGEAGSPDPVAPDAGECPAPRRSTERVRDHRSRKKNAGFTRLEIALPGRELGLLATQARAAGISRPAFTVFLLSRALKGKSMASVVRAA